MWRQFFKHPFITNLITDNHTCTHLFARLYRQVTPPDASQAVLFPLSLSLGECNHCLHPPLMGVGDAPAGCVAVLLRANRDARTGRSPVRPQTPTRGPSGCSSLRDPFFPGVTVERGCLARFEQGAAVTRSLLATPDWV